MSHLFILSFPLFVCSFIPFCVPFLTSFLVFFLPSTETEETSIIIGFSWFPVVIVLTRSRGKNISRKLCLEYWKEQCRCYFLTFFILVIIDTDQFGKAFKLSQIMDKMLLMW